MGYAARAIEIPFGTHNVLAVVWPAQPDAVLFIHDGTPDASADDWGLIPDQFAELGYMALLVDRPDHGGSPTTGAKTEIEAISACIAYLRDANATKVFVVTGGDAVRLLADQAIDGLVAVAPRAEPSLAASLGRMPKLFLAGRADPAISANTKALAGACRGWTLTSAVACEDDVTSLLQGRHAQQLRSQIASFLQEFRAEPSSGVSRTGTQNPR